MTTDKIEDAIEHLAIECADNTYSAQGVMQITQAVLNLAHAHSILNNTKKNCG